MGEWSAQHAPQSATLNSDRVVLQRASNANDLVRNGNGGVRGPEHKYSPQEKSLFGAATVFVVLD